MPTYRTTETYYSKRRRSNDYYGTNKKIPLSLKWNPISGINSDNSVVTWKSSGIFFVDIYISINGSEFSEVVLNYPNTGSYDFAGNWGNYSDVVLKLVGSGLVDLSNSFNYELIKPFDGEIYYLQDLYKIRENLNFDCTLMNNLDFLSDDSYDHNDPEWLTKKTLWTTTGWTPIENFVMDFNGDYFKIENLKTNSLFGTLEGNVQKLKLIGDLYCDTNDQNIGVICQTNQAIISECMVGGSITLDNITGVNCGGVTGLNEGIIINCYSKVDITNVGTVQGSIGGICGKMFNDLTSLIKYCYAIGSIPVMGSAGGIVGRISNPKTNGNLMYLAHFVTPSGGDTNGNLMYLTDLIEE